MPLPIIKFSKEQNTDPLTFQKLSIIRNRPMFVKSTKDSLSNDDYFKKILYFDFNKQLSKDTKIKKVNNNKNQKNDIKKLLINNKKNKTISYNNSAVSLPKSTKAKNRFFSTITRKNNYDNSTKNSKKQLINLKNNTKNFCRQNSCDNINMDDLLKDLFVFRKNDNSIIISLEGYKKHHGNANDCPLCLSRFQKNKRETSKKMNNNKGQYNGQFCEREHSYINKI